MIIKVSVSTNKVGSKGTTEFEIDDWEFEGVSEAAKDETINEIAQQAMFDMIDWTWSIKGE